MTKKNYVVFIVLSISMCVSLYPMQDRSVMGNRPKHVQEKVNAVYNENKKREEWGCYNGRCQRYRLLDLDKEKLLKSVCKGKKDIYILDVGCGQGRWGQDTAKMIRAFFLQKKEQSEKQVHIFNITGGKEAEFEKEITSFEMPKGYQKKEKDNVTLHWIDQCKIENVDEELKKTGFDLRNKCDLIVSNWAMRHLVDPFGTLKRLYSLLIPQKGMLLSTGFFFKFNDSKKIKMFPRANEIIGFKSNVPFIFKYEPDNPGQFLIKRPDEDQLKLPLTYTGETKKIAQGYDCASNQVTVFKSKIPDSEKFKHELFDPREDLFGPVYRIYHQAGDTLSQELFNSLKDVLVQKNKIAGCNLYLPAYTQANSQQSHD